MLAGDIPAQIEWAQVQSGRAAGEWIKLYNAGSFFDAGAVPMTDHPGIARLCSGFGRVVIENHPALTDRRILGFRDLLAPATRLEIAMGLETVHAGALERLNKRVRLEDFERAAAFTRAGGCGLRVFVLSRPPFVPADEVEDWLHRSVEHALRCGADPVVIVPTRNGNGAMERLEAAGEFGPTPVELLDRAQRRGIGLGLGRVFVDLWDLARFVSEPERLDRVRERLAHRNRWQQAATEETACDSSSRG